MLLWYLWVKLRQNEAMQFVQSYSTIKCQSSNSDPDHFITPHMCAKLITILTMEGQKKAGKKRLARKHGTRVWERCIRHPGQVSYSKKWGEQAKAWVLFHRPICSQNFVCGIACQKCDFKYKTSKMKSFLGEHFCGSRWNAKLRISVLHFQAHVL